MLGPQFSVEKKQERPMKLLVSALLLLAVILCWFLNVEISSSREQREQIQKLTASLTEKSKRDAFELQSKCAH